MLGSKFEEDLLTKFLILSLSPVRILYVTINLISRIHIDDDLRTEVKQGQLGNKYTKPGNGISSMMSPMQPLLWLLAKLLPTNGC